MTDTSGGPIDLRILVEGDMLQWRSSRPYDAIIVGSTHAGMRPYVNALRENGERVRPISSVENLRGMRPGKVYLCGNWMSHPIMRYLREADPAQVVEIAFDPGARGGIVRRARPDYAGMILVDAQRTPGIFTTASELPF
jgi:hypothetical protein